MARLELRRRLAHSADLAGRQGDLVEGLGSAADRVAPQLAEQIAWCESQGWDRSRYAHHPRWPRRIMGAGPYGTGGRAARTSGSDWWHTLDEVARLY